MYIIKNALKSITRTKLRNILIGIIILIIGISSTIGLSIKNSATKLIESYKESFEVEATLSLDRSSMQENFKSGRNSGTSQTSFDFMSNIPQLTSDEYIAYSNSEYVSSFKLTGQIWVNSKTIEKVTSEDTSDQKLPKMSTQIVINGRSMSNSDFTIAGYNSLEAMTEFINSTYKITEGEIFDVDASDNSCVISNELAEENGISVGNEITFVNPNNEEQTYTFKVVGIYKDESESNEFSMFSNAANQILISYNSLKNVVKDSSSDEENKLTMTTNASYILTSSDVIDMFSNELKDKGLSEYYIVNTNLESLDEQVKPILNLSSFSNMFLVLVLTIGGVILVVLNMINIRERKYEIGVLRAIGMKKHKVLLQFVIELFIVTFISIIIGAGIGSVLTVPVANNMLASEIESLEESNNQINQNFGKANMTSGGNVQINTRPGGGTNILNTFSNSKINYVDKINAVIDINTVIQLVLIGIVLTILSSSISMIFISRYTPLKILSNRT